MNDIFTVEGLLVYHSDMNGENPLWGAQLTHNLQFFQLSGSTQLSHQDPFLPGQGLSSAELYTLAIPTNMGFL